MDEFSGFRLARRLALALAIALPALASAACTRPVIVPVSPTGMSVAVSGQSVAGIYPELLRGLSAKGGCEFIFSVVPRARQEAMFETGRADMLIPAMRTARRDQVGYFIPLAVIRPAAISFDARHAPLRTIQDLRERKELRVALVRGYDYGAVYNALVKDLAAQGRVLMEADPVGVARLLHANYADLTIMAPNVLAAAVQGDVRVEAMSGKLRIEPLDELPWSESGAYISKASVTADDRAALVSQLTGAVKSGAVWEGFKRYYPSDILNSSIRPR